MRSKKFFIAILSCTLVWPGLLYPLPHAKCSTVLLASAVDTQTNSYQYIRHDDHVEITAYTGAESCISIPSEIEGLPVTKIGTGAMKGNTGLREVYLPVTMAEIGDEAFNGCTNLRDIHFSSILQYIGDRAFYQCIGLKVLILPEAVTDIGEEAFAQCNLQNVILPNNLRSIRNGIFQGNVLLDSISIPAGVDRIGHHAFDGCTSLHTVCYKGSSEAWAVLSIGNGNETLKTASILCDYNKQKVERSTLFNPATDSWAFLNKDVDYYVLSDERLLEMTEGMSNTEKASVKAFRDMIFKLGYQGSCAGMAVTSMLASAGILDPSDYDTNADCLHDLELTDDVRELLTYYLVLQSTDSFFAADIYNTDVLYSYLEQGKPVYFSYHTIVFDDDGQPSSFGHAVVAYGVEEGHWEFDGITFTKKILTYDSNVDDSGERDGCIYWEAEIPDDTDTSWDESLIYVPYVAERGGNAILPDPMVYSLDALNLHGMDKATSYEEPAEKKALLRCLALPPEYTVQSFIPGQHNEKTPADSQLGMAGIYQALSFPDAESGYAIDFTQSQAFDGSMSYEHWWYSVNTSETDNIAFEPDGCVSVSGQNTAYTMTMIADDGYYATDWYEITVSGTEADNVSIRQAEDGYVLNGNHLHNIQIHAQGDTADASLTFSTEESCVLVYEIDAGTLGIAADLDSNGTFETVLATSADTVVIGDVNEDGKINAVDAAEILIASAKVGAESESGLFYWQEIAADINKDGSFNATDAAYALQYAAMVGSGANITLEEFMFQFTAKGA